MPRILRIVNRFNLGGITYNAAYLTRYLEPEYETLLIGGLKEESEESSEFILHNLGITPVIVPEMSRSINVFDDYKAYKKIIKIIKEFKPDIVHTHAAKAGTLGRLAAAACKVPIIVHTFHGHIFHSYFGALKTGFYKNIERYLASKSSAIIAISDKQKHELSNTYRICKAKKITVVPLGFDLQKFQDNIPEKRQKFRTQYALQPDEIAIAIIGRLVPIKNHTLFLEALQLVLKQTNKKIRAFIVGDGAERTAIENLAKTLNIDFADGNQEQRPATLTFTSWIKDIDRVCAGVDLVCLTSLNEGTPVSLIEAQAGNKPIVSTNVGGIENVVLPGITALLSHTFDKHELAGNLLKITENDELRKQMGDKGWEHVKEKFHFTRLTADVSYLYRSLLNK